MCRLDYFRGKRSNYRLKKLNCALLASIILVLHNVIKSVEQFTLLNRL